jgi:hypothetical protein
MPALTQTWPEHTRTHTHAHSDEEDEDGDGDAAGYEVDDSQPRTWPEVEGKEKTRAVRCAAALRCVGSAIDL